MSRRPIFALLAALLLSAAPVAAQECAPEAQMTAEQAYATAYQFVSGRQWDEAAISLEQALEACPRHWASLELLAQARMQSKDADGYRAAARLYNELIKGQYNGAMELANERVLQMLGRCHLGLKNWKQAGEAYNAVLAGDPINESALKSLAWMYSRTGEDEEALATNEKLYEIAISEDEKGGYAAAIGKLYQKMGNDVAAAEWLGKGGGSGSKSLYSLGADYMKQKNWTEAAAAFEGYLETKSDSAPAWHNLGLCRSELKDFDGAVAALSKSLELDPARENTAVKLAFVYLDRNRFSDAASLASAKLGAWPSGHEHRASMLWVMAKVYEKRDSNYEAAIANFRQLASDPFWGKNAQREITRQEQLIERREAAKGGR